MLGLRISRPRRRPLGPLRTFACILGAATLGACASTGRLEPAPRPAATRIVVKNYSWERVTVYLAQGGRSSFLGALDAFSDGTFPVPRWALASVGDAYFIARPLAGRPYRSEPFILPSGGTAVWTIENQSVFSHVSLRR